MIKITYKRISKKFPVNKLKDFFDKTIPGKTTKQCRDIINYSSVIIGAYSKNDLIGINRALDDGVYAFLTDLIVKPDYRNRGIGTKITKILCQELKKRKVKVIHCSTSKSLVPLFKRIGFKYDQRDITMFLKR